MSNAPDSFQFNGFSGCNIEAYRSNTLLGEIRAISVKDSAGTILLIEGDRYVDFKLLDSEFDIVLTAKNEYGIMQAMTVCGCKLDGDVTINEANKMTIQSVDWWRTIL